MSSFNPITACSADKSRLCGLLLDIGSNHAAMFLADMPVSNGKDSASQVRRFLGYNYIGANGFFLHNHIKTEMMVCFAIPEIAAQRIQDFLDLMTLDEQELNGDFVRLTKVLDELKYNYEYNRVAPHEFLSERQKILNELQGHRYKHAMPYYYQHDLEVIPEFERKNTNPITFSGEEESQYESLQRNTPEWGLKNPQDVSRTRWNCLKSCSDILEFIGGIHLQDVHPFLTQYPNPADIATHLLYENNFKQTARHAEDAFYVRTDPRLPQIAIVYSNDFIECPDALEENVFTVGGNETTLITLMRHLKPIRAHNVSNGNDGPHMFR